MGFVVQACIVIVTMAVVTMTVVALRLLYQFRTATRQLEAHYLRLQDILEDSRETSRKMRDLMGVLEQTACIVRDGAGRAEGVVDRAATASHRVMDELQLPVIQALALVRGLRSGARVMMNRWSNGR